MSTEEFYASLRKTAADIEMLNNFDWFAPAIDMSAVSIDKNLTPSIDVYFFEEQSCQISLWSDLKRPSLIAQITIFQALRRDKLQA